MKTILKREGSRSVFAGYLKAAWPVFWGGVFEVWPAPGPRPALPHFAGADPPQCFVGLPGPPGPARPQKRNPQIRPDCLQVPSKM
jgi:hypothetical protein